MRRVLLLLGAIAAVATAAVWFAAEESYVTTLKATVGTSLNVTTHGSQNYGLVFGQEVRFGSMHIEINEKSIGNENFTGVDFIVACNDPVANGANTNSINAGSICDNIESAEFTPSGQISKLTVGGTQEMNIQWVFIAPDCEGAAQKKPADVKTVPCSQDKNWHLSGAISVDVVGYQGFQKQEICDKKSGNWVSGLNGEPILITLPSGEVIGPFECVLGDTFAPL